MTRTTTAQRRSILVFSTLFVFFFAFLSMSHAKHDHKYRQKEQYHILYDVKESRRAAAYVAHRLRDILHTPIEVGQLRRGRHISYAVIHDMNAPHKMAHNVSRRHERRLHRAGLHIHVRPIESFSVYHMPKRRIAYERPIGGDHCDVDIDYDYDEHDDFRHKSAKRTPIASKTYHFHFDRRSHRGNRHIEASWAVPKGRKFLRYEVDVDTKHGTREVKWEKSNDRLVVHGNFESGKGGNRRQNRYQGTVTLYYR